MSSAFTIEKTEVFENKLRETLCYIAHTLCAPQAAQELLQAVYAAQSLLAEFPYMHALSRHETFAARGYRMCFVRNYSIVYKVAGSKVTLLTFIHQSQDVDRVVVPE